MAFDKLKTDATDTFPYYEGVLDGKLTGVTKLWGGALVKFDDLVADQAIITFGDRAVAAVNSTFQLYRDDTGAVENGLVLDVYRVSGAIDRASGFDDGLNDANWHRVIFSMELTGSALDGTTYTDGVASETSIDSFAFGNFDQWEKEIQLGYLRDSLTNRLEGSLEDVFICIGESPTAQEITDLTTQTANKALADSASELIFYPDLLAADMKCRITGIGPTVATNPDRSVIKTGIDYGRDESVLVLGDPQYNGDAEWTVIQNKALEVKDALNISTVVCVGDWTQQADPVRLAFARRTVDAWAAAGLSVWGAMGNHDYDQTSLHLRNMTTMLDATDGLPLEVFSGQASFDEGMTETVRNVPPYDTDFYVYSAFIGEDWLYINLPMWALDSHYNWIVNKCAEYPDRKVHIGAHAFLNSSGSLHTKRDSGGGGINQYHAQAYGITGPLFGENPLANPEDDPSTGYWNRHLSRIPNLVLVTGGHDVYNWQNILTSRTVIRGQAGNEVLATFVNNQQGANFGNGFCQVMELKADSVQAFSFFLATDVFYGGPLNPEQESDFDFAIMTGAASDNTEVLAAIANLETKAQADARQATIDAAVATLPAAVDAQLLDAGDATDLIASIVARIGNTNVDETVFVSAIRSDLERAGGMLASIETKAEADARQTSTDATLATLSTAQNLAIASQLISGIETKLQTDTRQTVLTTELAEIKSETRKMKRGATEVNGGDDVSTTLKSSTTANGETTIVESQA